MHSTVSTLFIALIFYDTFVINRTVGLRRFLFFIIILIVGNRVGNGFYIFANQSFLSALCARQNHRYKEKPTLKAIIARQYHPSILFGTAIVGSSLIGQDQRKEIIGGHFTDENTARHFVQSKIL